MPDSCQPAVRRSEGAQTLSPERLPPLTITRWSARRKAQVGSAVEAGLLTEAEACGYYRLTREELTAWRRSMALAGERGPLVTRRLRPRWIDSLDAELDTRKMAFSQWDIQHDTIG